MKARISAAKWRWSLARSAGLSVFICAGIVCLATPISTVALERGWQIQTHGQAHGMPHVSWIFIFTWNLIPAALFYFSGRLRSRSFFGVLVLYNLVVWSLAASLIVPWMEKTNDWKLTVWLVSYIWFEVFAYVLANSLGRCRIRNVAPVSLLLAAAAFIESTGVGLLRR